MKKWKKMAITVFSLAVFGVVAGAQSANASLQIRDVRFVVTGSGNNQQVVAQASAFVLATGPDRLRAYFFIVSENRGSNHSPWVMGRQSETITARTSPAPGYGGGAWPRAEVTR